MNLNMKGHVLVKDKESGEILADQNNAIHYGNMARIVALALNNTADAYINFVAFGNGGTSVDTSGKVLYKTPRVSEAYDASSNLYNTTYNKDIFPGDTTNKIEIITGASYTDIKMTVTLGFSEPTDQEVFDTSITNEGDYIFDELGVFTNSAAFADAIMLTHVIFHPVQKSQNRVIEIIYTIRVQLS